MAGAQGGDPPCPRGRKGASGDRHSARRNQGLLPQPHRRKEPGGQHGAYRGPGGDCVTSGGSFSFKRRRDMALKVGLVGLRGIGMTHANAYQQETLGKLAAVCDLVKERADSTAEKFGVKAYYRLADMLQNEPDLDIVDVTTGGFENGSWHYEPAMEAMEAGKHVLVEKPLSNDVNEARQMAARAEAKNVYLGCNLNHSFTPPAEKARQY